MILVYFLIIYYTLPSVLPRSRNDNPIDLQTHKPFVNEWEYPNLAALAFPSLFPYGTGLFKDDTRPVPLKRVSKYFAHLLTYFDRRYVVIEVQLLTSALDLSKYANFYFLGTSLFRKPVLQALFSRQVDTMNLQIEISHPYKLACCARWHNE